MFNSLYYRLRFGAYRRNRHGIKKFAEHSMGQLIRKATKRSANYREMNETLMVEKANLRLRADELYERPMLDPGEFFSMKRRLWANTFIMVSFVIGAVILYGVALSAMLDGNGELAGLLQWSGAIVLALVLTGGGLVITERLVEAFYTQEQPNRLQSTSPDVGLLWGALLGGLLISIVGIADMYAQTVVGGNLLVHVGFVLLAVLLPIVAGAIRWDVMRYIDRYKVTQSLREIESRLAQIDSLLRQHEEFESNYYKMKSIVFWDKVNDFKTYKDNYNERQGITEHISGHFAESYKAWQREADARYRSDIRDFTSQSMRRLPLSGSRMGRKVGQKEKAERPQVAPTTSRRGAKPSDRQSQEKQEPSYLDPQPVR